MAAVASTLVSAIPPHLQQPRSLPVSTPPNYQPPFPAYSAIFPTSTKDIVMAIIGIQHDTKPETSSLPRIQKFLHYKSGNDDGRPSSNVQPRYMELASVTDNSGFYNEAAISYWATKSDFEEWSTRSGFQTWWDGLNAEQESCGWFLEVFFPTVERFETLFSDNDVPEGAANMRTGVSGEIREHVYWGSMRDRLPASQTLPLHGEKWKPDDAGEKSPVEEKTRVKISGKQNLAMIRSGQDWSNTTPHERKLYLDTMHPVLIRGMDFLRDSGEEVGCFSCRFMDVLDKDTLQVGKTDKTFGLAYFDDLASLEGWSKRHKTHLDIFGRFLQYAKELENNVSLRLFHEVMVLESGQQRFEYVGCHAKTGMLAAKS